MLLWYDEQFKISTWFILSHNNNKKIMQQTICLYITTPILFSPNMGGVD